MKDAILLELAKKWEQDAKAPQCEDGSPEAQRGNYISQGRREGKRECADAIRMLVQLLGGNRYESDQAYAISLKDHRVT